MQKTIFIIFQYLTPQHALSRLVGYLAKTEITLIKNFLIKRFVKHYHVNLSEAERESPEEYLNFNDFFCRALKEGARTISPNKDDICSPADGAISQLGNINEGRIFQAKGQSFTCEELIGGNAALAKTFANGVFNTIYLSPKDYHRVHMPCDGKLLSMTHIPGDLFSVNTTTAENVPRLFSRNERVACVFETEYGAMIMVLVGAMIVASIDTVWAGQIAPTGQQVTTTHYNSKPEITLNKGEEMGRFKLGSTVVLLFPEKSIMWKEDLKHLSPVKMGETIALKNTKEL